jgi:hypothetical protein
MSTKNLARTVIEGGRHRQNISQRRFSNAQERTSERQLTLLLRDRLDADAVVHQQRAPVYRQFDDKLRPAQRWLESQAGRPWNKVRSELFARFDTRTTAGRHIVFDHLLKSVEHEPERFARRHALAVDRHGFLRKIPYRRKGPKRERLPENETEIQAWLAGRRVTLHGDALFWFVATRAGYFRQDKALSAPEIERFLALPGWYRQLLAQHWAEAPASQGAT